MPNAQAYTLLRRLQEELHEAREYLRNLPTLTLADVSEDDYCPICFNSLPSIISEYTGKTSGGSADGKLACAACANDESCTVCKHGVVKLESCGHIFCRMDLMEWIDSLHGTCPTCRTIFFPFTQYSEADLESSDGGEYLPDDDEVEMDDDDEYEDEDDGLDEVDYDAFPTSDIDDGLDSGNSTGQAGDQWRQVINVMSGARSRVFRAARDIMTDEGISLADQEGEDEEDDWMDEDATLSSSAGDMTEGSDGPTSDELSSNNGDGHEEHCDDAEVCETDSILSLHEPQKDGSTSNQSSTYEAEMV